MMDLIEQYLFFFAKIATFFLLTFLLLAALKKDPKAKLKKPQITLLNQELYSHIGETLKELSDLANFKTMTKEAKSQQKQLKKIPNLLYVLDFSGDMHASQTTQLRKEIDLLLNIAQPDDKVLLRLESRGGTITGYGLAASQLDRIKKAGLHITVAIDQVAASGGYLMASIANEIIAAPFATIGSIGVVAEMPNIYDLLEKVGIKYLQVTAGKHKRLLSPYTEETPQAKEKVQSDINLVHQLFQDHIKNYRDIDVAAVATGETWPAITAKNKGLVDKIMTSDCAIMEAMKDHLVLHLHTPKKTSLLHSLCNKAYHCLIT